MQNSEPCKIIIPEWGWYEDIQILIKRNSQGGSWLKKIQETWCKMWEIMVSKLKTDKQVILKNYGCINSNVSLYFVG